MICWVCVCVGADHTDGTHATTLHQSYNHCTLTIKLSHMRTYVALDPERTVTNQLSHAFVHYTHQPVDLNICGKWMLAAFNRAGALQRKSHQHLAITSHQHLATSTWPSRHSQPVRAQMASALTPITTSLWGMQYSVHSKSELLPVDWSAVATAAASACHTSL